MITLRMPNLMPQAARQVLGDALDIGLKVFILQVLGAKNDACLIGILEAARAVLRRQWPSATVRR